MKSAAVVNYAPEKGSVEIRDIDRPSIGPDDVLAGSRQRRRLRKRLASMDRAIIPGR